MTSVSEPGEHAFKRESISSRFRDYGLGAALIALTVIVYLPALHGGFLLDDDLLLTNNPLIKDPNGWWKFWATTSTPDYLPLMSDTLWAEWRLFGMNPVGYHTVNILLHAISAVLFWRLLTRLKIPGAYFAAAIFACHPVAARSVGWIAELKNTLSMPLFLLSLIYFVDWTDRKRNKPGLYAASIALFACALLVKSSVVVLPLVLVLYLIWLRQSNADPLTQSRKMFAATIPFFALAAVFSLTTVLYQVHESIEPLKVTVDPLSYRLASAGYDFWFYFAKLIWPVNLAMIYPKWRIDTSNFISYLPLILAAVMGVALWINAKNSAVRAAAYAYAFFAIGLLPVLGFVPMAFYASSMVSDHLQYIAMLGPIALVASGAAYLMKNQYSSVQIAVAGVGVAIICILGAMTYAQAGLYRDRVALAEDTLRTNPDSFWAHGEVGNSLMSQGRNSEAAAQFHEVLRLRPQSAPAWNNLGIIAVQAGDLKDAESDFRNAVRVQPTFKLGWLNLSQTLEREGDHKGAAEAVKKAGQ